MISLMFIIIWDLIDIDSIVIVTSLGLVGFVHTILILSLILFKTSKDLANNNHNFRLVNIN